MSDADCPPFMEGTFLFDENGYRFSSKPPLDLMSSAAVSSRDPWIALAAALEHAKAGNHEHVSRLLDRVERDTAPRLVIGMTALVGDAGSERDVEGLIDLMDESHRNHTRALACEAAAHSGYIWMAPIILDCWSTLASPERGQVALSLKILLERSGSEISDFGRFEKDIDYIALVEERGNEIFAKYGDHAIWHALPIQARRVASEIGELIHQESVPTASALIAPCRQRLEAMTGIDCSDFYDRELGCLRPRRVAAKLEALAASGRLDGFVDGKRYFFGHLVPNS